MVAADWKASGVEVDVKFFEQSDLSVEVIRPRKYDALLFGEVVGRDPDLFAFWHSSQRNDPGLNIALYANTDTDKKLSDARTETDPDVRREKTKAAANAIAKETAALFLYAPHFVYLSPATASGIVFGTISSPSDRFDAVDQWYLETEQVWPIFSINWNSLFKN
jgi:peptide/nickel transport system substrate-binding protein